MLSTRDRLLTPGEFDRPVAAQQGLAGWGSDVIAETLQALNIPYVCLNPGASYRGLHDSIVNHLGNKAPQMLLCLHEGNAVAIAHGYAKVSGSPLGVILHSNVGLMQGAMGIFNAWCDRVPVLVMGATGPMDAAQRRPWIDWIHTAQDQGALIRNFTKWDDQPTSVAAAQEALLRATQIASTLPCGPVYVCFDAGMQEAMLSAPPMKISAERFKPPTPSVPSDDSIARIAQLLLQATHPVFLMGRVSRSEADWAARVALAERLGASVLTDLKVAATFPTDHPLHGPSPGLIPSSASLDLLRSADVILSLDWVDLAGTLKLAWPSGSIPSTVIQISLDQYLHNGWSKDHLSLPPSDEYVMAAPDAAVSALLKSLSNMKSAKPARNINRPEAVRKTKETVAGNISVKALAEALLEAVGNGPTCLVRAPLSWSGEYWPVRHPLDFLGYDGGGGIGSGPGMAVGAALALQGTGRLPVAVIGDGDFLMGNTALWTAVHYRIPMLLVIANNRSFFNDEIHQDRVARVRGRPVENRWIGQRITDPDVDLAATARAQGAIGFGQISTGDHLASALTDAVATVLNGACCVVDVRVISEYNGGTVEATTREESASRI